LGQNFFLSYFQDAFFLMVARVVVMEKSNCVSLRLLETMAMVSVATEIVVVVVAAAAAVVAVMRSVATMVHRLAVR
jgi:hypothetical protein